MTAELRTQRDPCEETDPRTVLLFQLDSDYGNETTKVMWGDAGIGGFFCSPEALAARYFSDILYNWDCG